MNYSYEFVEQRTFTSNQFNEEVNGSPIISKTSMTQERSYKCWTCNESFNSCIKLGKHVKDLHVEEDAFKCTICKRSYHTLSELAAHDSIHRFGSKNFHECYKCGAFYADESRIEFHTNYCHLKNVSCVNYKKSKNKFDLSRHVEEHTSKKSRRPIIIIPRISKNKGPLSHQIINSAKNSN